MKTLKYFLLIFILSGGIISAQSASIGVDFVSKYIWRGLVINNAPNIQPAMSFTAGGATLGFWGSYSTGNSAFGTDELDAFLDYTFGTEAGDFSVIITDYYFPNAGVRLGDFADGGGAHTIELGISYSGPFSFFAGYNFLNDPGKNVYLELGYSAKIGDVGLDFAVGSTPGSKTSPVYYGAESFSVINVSITGSKSLKISESFELPIFTGLIVNPKAEVAHLVAGFSIAL